MTNPKSTSKQILIVEDDGVIANRLRHVLTRLGYDVLETIPSGEKVLQTVAQTPPDLALMDIHLAGKLNGIETIAQIYIDFNLPAIYLTAHSEDAVLQSVAV